MDDAPRIGITGSYGGLNLGDEAILESLLAPLRADFPAAGITVFSRNAADTAQRHGVRAVPIRDLGRDEAAAEVARLDLLILGGGGILYDAEARTYLREVLLAREAGVPVQVLAVSVGPLKDPAVQAAVREALEGVEGITVRDRASRHLLEEIGLRRPVEVTADPALLLCPRDVDPDVLKVEGLDGDGPVIGMSVREAGAAAPDLDEGVYHELLANTADFLIDRVDADVVFFPMERGGLDVQQSHAVLSRMARPQRGRVLKGEYGSPEVLSLVGRLAFAVGMRLHFLIFAAVQRVPFVALPYSSKVLGFLEALEVPAPPVDRASPGQVLAYVDRAWDQRHLLREALQERVPGLAAEARRNHAQVARILRERPRRRAGR